MKPNPLPDHLSLQATWNDKEVAKYLGVKVYAVGILARASHLPCLGGYRRGCGRRYAPEVVRDRGQDVAWKDEAFRIIRSHHSDKRLKASQKQPQVEYETGNQL